MSSSSHAPAADAHGHEKSKVRIFVQLAVILAIITAIEIGILFMPLSSALRIGSLVILSIVKFLMVIFIFMHLRWDKMFCTILFFIGLSLAGGTVAALLAVFRGKDSIPLSSHASLTMPAREEARSEKREARMVYCESGCDIRHGTTATTPVGMSQIQRAQCAPLSDSEGVPFSLPASRSSLLPYDRLATLA